MTPRAWRLSKEKYAVEAFSGERARLYRGRWNRVGIPMIYAVEHISLAVLEILVGLEDLAIHPRYVLFQIGFEAALVEFLADDAIPRDCRVNPPPLSTQVIGDRSASEARSAVLCVPSAVIPSEKNYLLNPRHPDFGQIFLGDPMPYDFDPRLFES